MQHQVMAGEGTSMSSLRETYGKDVATLMGAALVLDTRLFKGKCVEADRVLAKGLGYVVEGGDGGDATAEAQEYFKVLSAKRADVRGLTSAQKLRKDYKRWGEGQGAYGIATIPCSIQDWASDDSSWGDALAQYATEEQVGLMMSMHTFTDANGQFSRELVVHCADASKLEAVCKHMCADGHRAVQEATGAGSLMLTEHREFKDLVHTRAFQQGNLKASRKQVQPVTEAFMNGR